MESEIGQFGIILLFIAGGGIFIAAGLLVSKILAPNRPNPEKLSSYECGEDPVGNARIQLNNRFYVVALIFLIFEVEIIFLFPWATVFADPELIRESHAWGYLSFIEVTIFTIILIAGLAYVWVKGDLDWVRPRRLKPEAPSAVPDSAYAAFNERMESKAPKKPETEAVGLEH